MVQRTKWKVAGMRRKAAEHRRDFPIRPWAWQGLIAQGIAPEREVVLE